MLEDTADHTERRRKVIAHQRTCFVRSVGMTRVEGVQWVIQEGQCHIRQ